MVDTPAYLSIFYVLAKLKPVRSDPANPPKHDCGCFAFPLPYCYNQLHFFLSSSNMYMVVNAYNPGTREAEGRKRVKASLSLMAK